MKTIIKYIADDGTPFSDEKECLNYEEKVKIARNNIEMISTKGKILFSADIRNDFNNTCILYCKTDEAAKFLYGNLRGFITPWSCLEEATAGIWLFNKDCEWTDISYATKAFNTFFRRNQNV